MKHLPPPPVPSVPVAGLLGAVAVAASFLLFAGLIGAMSPLAWICAAVFAVGAGWPLGTWARRRIAPRFSPLSPHGAFVAGVSLQSL